jgi:hypothetical protein
MYQQQLVQDGGDGRKPHELRRNMLRYDDVNVYKRQNMLSERTRERRRRNGELLCQRYECGKWSMLRQQP